MIKKPELFDLYYVNEHTLGVVIEIDEFYIKLLCKNKLTGQTYVVNEHTILDGSNKDLYKIFDSKYKYLRKSKIIDVLFEE